MAGLLSPPRPKLAYGAPAPGGSGGMSRKKSVRESRCRSRCNPQRGAAGRLAVDPAGLAWFAVAIVAALPLFWIGFTGLAAAWARPEYSHGPVIPLLSFYMFLREMRDVPPAAGPVTDRRLGVIVIGLALSDRRARQPGADRRHRLLRADRLDRRPGADAVRRAPRHHLLALGAAPRLHAAAAAVPLLEAQHRAAARLLRDRGLVGRARSGCRSSSTATSSTSGSTSCRWPRPARACATSSRS